MICRSSRVDRVDASRVFAQSPFRRGRRRPHPSPNRTIGSPGRGYMSTNQLCRSMCKSSKVDGTDGGRIATVRHPKQYIVRGNLQLRRGGPECGLFGGPGTDRDRQCFGTRTYPIPDLDRAPARKKQLSQAGPDYLG